MQPNLSYLSNLQPSNLTANAVSRETDMKPNPACHSNIAIVMLCISVSVSSWYSYNKVTSLYVSMSPSNLVSLTFSFPIYWLALAFASGAALSQTWYRGKCSKLRCDVTEDVIVVKMVLFYQICHLVFTSECKSKQSCTRHGFWKFPKTIMNNNNQTLLGI